MQIQLGYLPIWIRSIICLNSSTNYFTLYIMKDLDKFLSAHVLPRSKRKVMRLIKDEIEIRVHTSLVQYLVVGMFGGAILWVTVSGILSSF